MCTEQGQGKVSLTQTAPEPPPASHTSRSLLLLLQSRRICSRHQHWESAPGTGNPEGWMFTAHTGHTTAIECKQLLIAPNPCWLLNEPSPSEMAPCLLLQGSGGLSQPNPSCPKKPFPSTPRLCPCSKATRVTVTPLPRATQSGCDLPAALEVKDPVIPRQQRLVCAAPHGFHDVAARIRANYSSQSNLHPSCQQPQIALMPGWGKQALILLEAGNYFQKI